MLWAAAAHATPLDTQLQVAAGAAVKLTVRQPGWYRVTQPQLVAAGLPADVDPDKLQLFADGVEQAIEVTGNAGAVFDANAAIEFYGTGRDTLWTDAHTYWLVVGAAGARIPKVLTPLGNATPTSFSATQTLREHKTYYAPLLNGDASNFFGDTVDGTGVTETLMLSHVGVTTTAVLSVALQGVTAGGHFVTVSSGGNTLGSCDLSGQEATTCTFSLPAVVEGANAINLVSTGAAPDISLVASASIVYDHALLADGDQLAFTVPAGARVTLGGFSTSDVRVVDVTAPAAPIELGTFPGANGGTFGATFNTPGGELARVLWAFTDVKVGAPASVAASRPSSWATTGAGELVVIANAAFVDAVRPLVDRRVAEGWTVALVDVQDVYDEFGAGDKTAFAIRDFLQYAGAHWRVPPRDVLLVGDATFDPRNFTGQGDFDFVPTKLVDTASMETSSDGWFVDWNDDGVPDIAVGRIPVRTAADATIVVGKTLAYAGRGDLPRGGLFVTDIDDGDLDFEAASAQSQPVVADIMPVDTFMRSSVTATPAGLIAKLNQGPFLVNYFGHGSVEVWDDLFSSTDAAALTNASASIYVSMNCLNGFFHDVYTTSLAEVLLEAPQGGAVAAWASSTLTSFDPQLTLNREFLRRLSRTSLGEADIEAKKMITDLDAQRTWMIFGDPTLFGAPTESAGGGGADGGATDGAARGDATTDASATDGHADAAMMTTMGDAAIDGGAPTDDARADADAGKEKTASGCSCDVANGAAPRGAWLALAVLGALARRRRRHGAA
jgi:MYXO-CTERM domain-containing protein